MSQSNENFQKTRKTRESQGFADLQAHRIRKQKRQQAHKQARRDALEDR
ncbi:hypothetical protein [Delftia phage IME-DE1]|uniref:Uncharacterized protein n=1 Tax=Delftia phage IME-DE1 TaxID=1647385 RepID=A0A0F7IK56_9CAUD|nr:hypothetical protein AU155_gp20 [Delftia phage IME-DE1]AKG94483.1 hypothetical protein [Delftia phage IME-DE1]